MELNRTYNENCIDTMSRMESNFIDLVVTSPPYDNLRDYKGYCFDFEPIAKELNRILKIGGVMVWVVGDQTLNGSESGTSFKQALFFMSLGLNLHDTMIYKKWSGPLTHNRYEQEFEYMFVFSKGKVKTFNPILIKSEWFNKDSDRTGQKYTVHGEANRKLRSGKNRGNIKEFRQKGNVWEIKNSSQSGEHYGHPAPFPEKLAEDHIRSWSNEGDLIYDPFGGSGTSAKMSIKLKRNYILSEISGEYCDIISKRINAVQQDLF